MKRKLRFLNMEPEQVARRAARQKTDATKKQKQRGHDGRLLVAVLQTMHAHQDIRHGVLPSTRRLLGVLQSIRNLLGVLQSIQHNHEGSARVVGGAATSARADRPQGFTNALLMVWQRGILRHR